MAALGKGIGRSAGGGWRRRAATTAAVAIAAAGILSSARLATASQDPFFSRQWNLVQIGAPAAWQRSTGAGVRIGIVDSGVESGHEDLAGKVVAATDCINTGGDPRACAGSGQDDSGHGTHMAGIAAAAKDNGRGIAGVAPDAELVVARVLTDDGGTIGDVEAGIRWVVQHGAQVVNLSLGDNPRAQAPLDLSFEAAIEEAWAAGAVPVVASGNPNALGPGKEDFASLDALVVGATDTRGTVAPYSNPLTTTKWGLVAPGGSGTGDGRDIVSTWWDPSAPMATNRYAFRAGASIAAAHASGVVALLLAEGLSRDQVVQRIIATARPIACGAGCHGLLDAAAAVGATAAPAAVVAGASRASASATAARRPPSAPTPTPVPVPTTSTPTTAGAATEQATTGAGQEAVRVARERALGTTDVAGARDEVPSPGTVWAAIALMTAAAFGLGLSGRRGR